MRVMSSKVNDKPFLYKVTYKNLLAQLKIALDHI